jgi:hypothetical protein
MAVCQNIKIAGKWMFIPLKMVLIGIDPYPHLPGLPTSHKPTIGSNSQKAKKANTADTARNLPKPDRHSKQKLGMKPEATREKRNEEKKRQKTKKKPQKRQGPNKKPKSQKIKP